MIHIGEAFEGDGANAAHINLVLGRKDELGAAYALAAASPGPGHIPFQAVVRPNLPAKPPTLFVGKSVLKIKVVSENSGQPIGFGLSIVRQLAHIVDAIICYIGFLFPLWDAKRQTLADKIMTTVVLPIA